MRIRRTFPIALVVVIVAAAVTLAVQLRKHAPPEPARLLPGADAFFYLNLKSARRANSGKELPAVSHDPEYERFIRETQAGAEAAIVKLPRNRAELSAFGQRLAS